ncbi:MAG TPA: hypothetical protein VIJ33_08035 [Solirubrobacteraceae bacterium]
MTTDEPEIRVRYDGTHAWRFPSEEKVVVAHLVKKLQLNQAKLSPL